MHRRFISDQMRESTLHLSASRGGNSKEGTSIRMDWLRLRNKKRQLSDTAGENNCGHGTGDQWNMHFDQLRDQRPDRVG